jgi:phosphoheptose isomerase
VNSRTFFEELALEIEIARVVPQSSIEDVITLIKALKIGSKIFSCGNGGSASTAEHLCADLSTGSNRSTRGINSFSLNSNVSVVTQVANDLGYDEIFSEQLKLMASQEDLIFIFSASGNSKNLIRAAEQSKELGCTSIGITGFDGGKLRKIVDHSVHFETDFGAYGLVENLHLSLVHYLTSRYRLWVSSL